jgi:UPF0755 protein
MRALFWLLVLLVIAALATGALYWWAKGELQRPFAAYDGERKVIDVEPGTSAGAILADLEREGVLADARLTRLYLIHVLEDPPLKAGEYAFDAPMSATEVLEKLIAGEVLTHPVTIIEGLDLEETANSLAGSGFGDVERFLAEMRSPDRILDLDPEAENLEGYLYPDTYSFAKDTSEAEIVDALVRAFRDRLSDELAAHGFEPEPEALRDLVTLASIVEKEAALDDERPVIAGVYANRLRRGMGLYADPTVIYALKLAGTWDGNIRKPDLQIDSPYNTYRYPGLPPGPICSPGLASLEAALTPADVPYLYFVSRNDGSHVFAKTLAEHNRNVNEWQKRYWRERWARESKN